MIDEVFWKSFIQREIGHGIKENDVNNILEAVKLLSKLETETASNAARIICQRALTEGREEHSKNLRLAGQK